MILLSSVQDTHCQKDITIYTRSYNNMTLACVYNTYTVYLPTKAVIIYAYNSVQNIIVVISPAR